MAQPQPVQTHTSLVLFIDPAYVEVSLLSNVHFGPYRKVGWQIY